MRLLNYLLLGLIESKNEGNGTKARRQGLMYQPVRQDDLLGARNLNIFKRNGKPRTGGLNSIVTLSDQDKQALVNAQNLRRAAVAPKASNMKMVEWDETLAASAAVHAKRCQFAHSTPDQLYHPVYRHQIGENLAVFRGPSKFVNDLFIWIVDGFYEERKYYDYKTSGCTAECGHYEVLVHADQERMGCAVSTCSTVVDAFKKLHRTELGDSPFFIVVCHYAPVVLTPTLYTEGKACTNCSPGWDFCTAGLCTQKANNNLLTEVGGLKLDAGMEDLKVGNIYVWSQWSSCTRSCGSGIQWRFRMCEGCKGPEGEMKTCNMQQCKNEGWANWQGWTQCSQTCGKDSTRSRKRDCRSGIYGNAVCKGVSKQFQTCSLPTCSQWSNWNNWQACSVTCGTGTKRRTRTCNRNGNDKCIGSWSQTELCDPGACGGKWDIWADWTDCSVTCGSGVQTRDRTCSGMIGKGNCVGTAKERRECHEGLCDVIRTPISMDNACELESKKVIKCDNENFASFPVVASKFIDRNSGAMINYKGIATLNLANNNISSLSGLSMACKLMKGKIDTLDLTNNKISELKKEDFESCVQIKHLILKGNPIKTFDPSIFMKMRRLEKLYMDYSDDTCWSTQDLLKFVAAASKLKLKLQIS